MSIQEEVKEYLLTSPVYSGSLPATLSSDYPLIDSGVLDSIGLFTLVVHLEKKFDVKIEVLDLIEKNFGNLQMIENFVESKTIRS